jgi:hypothetical protein
LQGRQQQFGQQVVAEVVDAKLELEARFRGLRRRVHHARIVHEPVQCSARQQERPRERPYRIEIRQIERGDVDVSRPFDTEPIGDTLTFRWTAAGKHHPRTLCCQLCHGAQSDARIASGDNKGPVGKIERQQIRGTEQGRRYGAVLSRR